MRSRELVIGLCLAATAAAIAASPRASSPTQAPAPAQAAQASPLAKASPPAKPPAKFVHLDRATLEELRIINPRRYARVQRILASAEQLCKPGEPKVLRLDAQNIRCEGSFIFTSYPPQRELMFQLDDTLYIAMVFLKLEPKLTTVHGSTAGVVLQGSPPAR
jgi:hypothetical protein